MSGNQSREHFQGYVVDIGCLRKYPREHLLKKAKEHTKQCLTMGHCIESGYGLVSEKGELTLLDDEATLQLLHVLKNDKREKGNKVKVTREVDNEEMKTVSIKLV